MNQKPKRKKAGRPSLPKGNARAEFLRARVTLGELRAYEAAAKAKNQTVSEWARSTLNAAS